MERGEKPAQKSQPQLAVKPSVSSTARCTRWCTGSQPQLAVKPSVSLRVSQEAALVVTTTASCEAFCEKRKCSYLKAWKSQPQLAVKPSVRLAFFYPYISGSARAFFPGGGQNRGRNGRFSTPSRKMAKWRRILPVFQGGYCCRFFSPPGHYQEMHSKRRRLSAPRPRMSRHAVR